MDSFFRTYYDWMKDFYLEFESEKYELTPTNYWNIVLRESEVTEKDFLAFEQEIGLKVPTPLKEFYQLHYSLETSFECGNAVSIAGNIAGAPTQSLRKYSIEYSIGQEVLKHNLLPFGMYNDEWFICFDLNEKNENPSIVLFEMSNWANGRAAISHRKWFSNFEKFILCMESYIRNNHNKEFIQIDPANNFDRAYDYWKN